MKPFTGVATALLTPFSADGASIDYKIMAQSIDWQINQGINALVVAGTTGEAAALSEEEQQELIAFTVDYTAGRVPVIAGTGCNNIDKAIRLTRFATQAGADAALIVNPYYNKTTQAGLIAHFTAIHEQTELPIILYNVPSRTGMNMAPETVARLAKLERIVGIKEASNQFNQITELARLLPEDFFMYSGNDDTVLPFLALGGQGVISVASNIIPNQMIRLAEACLTGAYLEARAIQLACKPLIDGLFLETSPSPSKFAATYLNRCQGPLRLPLVSIEEKTQSALKQRIDALALPRGW